MRKVYHVYILRNSSGMLYIGSTNDLMRRLYQHKNKFIHGFTAKYNIDKLVFYQEFPDVRDAIEAERKMKGWVRRKKDELIKEFNPEWKDLSEGWF